ncbi:MAG: DUF892 family protein [Phycisphaerales bacterium]
MDHEQAKDRLIAWLKDAHAMESALETTLTKQMEHAESDTTLHMRLKQHREETRQHAKLVEQILHRYGTDESALKDMTGKTQALFTGWFHGSAPDTAIKDVLAGVAAEHYEIACYRALQAAATALGDNETVRICEQILLDEKDMAEFLEAQLPRVTQLDLAEA